MMTPAQLKNYEFKTAGRNAYKADDVDTFLAEVIADYEKMFRENSELIKRINLLATKVEEYQQDEAQIKQAVISAQRAADLIVKEAEDSVADAKAEAEAILAAAKGEAAIIVSDAEKQAVADSELVLALATDKAEDIIAKAKEKAHDILIEANASASDTVGQANRTITSESLHYDMLKKEVAEFRASLLSQYKAHIELISKLPDLAVEEAAKIEGDSDEVSTEEAVAATFVTDDSIEYVVSDNDTDTVSEDSVDVTDGVEINEDDDTIEYVSDDEQYNEITEEDSELTQDSEPVVKTELPYDFFEEDSSLEFVDDNDAEEEPPISEIDAFENSVGMEFDEDATDCADEEADNFSVDVEGIDLSLFEENDEEGDESIAEISSHTVVEDEEPTEDDDVSGFFDSIETISDDEDDEDEDTSHRGGFFGRWHKK